MRSRIIRRISIVLYFVVIALFLSASADLDIHKMVNCANPEGLTVIETGRVIELNEVFDVYGIERLEDNGNGFLRVYDGEINSDYVCEYQE